MELARIILLGVLLLLAWVIWNAWDHQYSQPIRSEPVQTSAAYRLTQPLFPVHKTTISTGSIPDDQSSNSRFIYVKTDVLDIAIDTLGGNLILADLLQYPQTTEQETPFQLLNLNTKRYYVAQSGLLSNHGPDTQTTQAKYHASQTYYQLTPDNNQLIVDLEWRKENLTIHKQFIFKRNDYLVEMRYRVHNKGYIPWSGQVYTQLQRRKTENPSSFLTMNSYYVGGAISTQKKAYQKISFEKMATKDFPEGQQEHGWIALLQHYFVTAWIPKPDQIFHLYSHAQDGIYTLGMLWQTVSVPPGAEAIVGQSKLYLGPEVLDRLKAVAPNLNLTIDYGIFWPISSSLFWLLKHIYKIIGNWGWSIVLVTVLIKLAFYHLSARSYRSMAQIRNLQPRLQALKERYGEDRQKLTQATMELYRTEKVNPLGGCLPVLVQIPVFLGLYWMLLESVELRQAPFLFWIHDLSTKDPYYFLPILMGITMLIQQKLNPPSPDPMQAKVMQFLPIFFTALFLNFPSGLVLYWVVNNALSIAQQAFIMHRTESKFLKKKRSY